MERLNIPKDDESLMLEDDVESVATITIHAHPSDLSSKEFIESEFGRFAFSDELQKSRVYRRNQAFRNSVISALTNSAYSLRWSVLSDLSMAGVSNISVINLAITEGEVFNPRRASQTWSVQPDQGPSIDNYVDGQRTQPYKVAHEPTSAAISQEHWPVSIQIEEQRLPSSCSRLPQPQPIETPDIRPQSEERSEERESTRNALDPTSIRQPATQHHSCDLLTSQALSPQSLPHDLNQKLLLVGDSVSEQIQIAELQNLVSIVNTEWLLRMEVEPVLCSRCKTLLTSSLFETAVRALRDFNQGVLPSTFEDVFAIMHLAFATAFFLHWQHDDYSFGALLDDALQWQLVLSSNEDKVEFLIALSLWWLPEVDSTALLRRNYMILYSSTIQERLEYSDQREIFDRLKNNAVFRIFIGFLDGKSIRFRFEILSVLIIL